MSTVDQPRNRRPLVVTIVVAAFVVVACVVAYIVVAKPFDSRPEADATAPPTTSVPAGDALYDLADYPRVDASTATHPLAMGFINDFTGQEVDQETLGFTQTHSAYVRLIDKEVDLILVTSPSAEELALAAEKGMELEVIPVVSEAFVFFVNGANAIEDLTAEQIRSIYAGEITNWSQVGGPDVAIRAFQRPVNSGSQTGMIDLVMKDKPLMEPPTQDVLRGMDDIVEQVADFDNSDSAIGYSYYYYVTAMFDGINPGVTDDIKLLSVDGVMPMASTVASGQYPFTTAYYIVIDKAAAADSPARVLANHMLSDRGQTTAGKAGYVPLG